ncbi:hypothetical protein Hanom_Chr00s006883g01736181 [Helianthus anomalus]
MRMLLGEFKRGVDVALADWCCVREGTPLLRECPSHPYLVQPHFQFRDATASSYF